jgi:hypothetical protein
MPRLQAAASSYVVRVVGTHFLMSARPGQTQPGRTDVRTGTERIFLHEHEWLDELTAADLHRRPVLPAADHPLAVLGQRLFTARRLPRAWTDTIAPTTTTGCFGLQIFPGGSSETGLANRRRVC